MIVILDIETQELIPEHRRLDGMRISIAGVQQNDRILYFTEDQLPALFTLLDDAELIVGHNLLHFDYKILQRYTQFDIATRYRKKTFDILHEVMLKTDRTVGLNDLAQRNLGMEKLGSGKDAPQLFKDGRLEELKAYLAQDLQITSALFKHIQTYGRLKYGHKVYKEPVEREIIISIAKSNP